MKETTIRSLAFFVLVTFIATLRMPVALAASTADYDPQNSDWNGLSKTFARTQLAGYPSAVVRNYDLTVSPSKTILVILYPTFPIDSSLLANYVERGGRVLVANDFGSGLAGIPQFDITFDAVQVEDNVANYNGRSFAPVMDKFENHPITEGINSVVTNHPGFLSSQDGIVASFSSTAYTVTDNAESRSGNLVFAVAKNEGKGRIVAISDPSIFINHMIDIDSNQAFFSRILEWLSDGDNSYNVIFWVPVIQPNLTKAIIAEAISDGSKTLLQSILVVSPIVFAAIGIGVLRSRATRIRQGWEESKIISTYGGILRSSFEYDEFFQAAYQLGKQFEAEIGQIIPSMGQLSSKQIAKQLMNRMRIRGFRRQRRFRKDVTLLLEIVRGKPVHIDLRKLGSLTETTTKIRETLGGKKSGNYHSEN